MSIWKRLFGKNDNIRREMESNMKRLVNNIQALPHMPDGKAERFWKDHPDEARDFEHLWQLLEDCILGDPKRIMEVGPGRTLGRLLEILLKFKSVTGCHHPDFQTVFDNYAEFLKARGKSPEETLSFLEEIVRPHGVKLRLRFPDKELEGISAPVTIEIER